MIKTLLASLLFGLSLTACGQNPYDAFLAAMRAQGAAERGSCQMHFNKDKRVLTVNSGKVALCIRDLKDAQILYEKARQAGYEGKDIDDAEAKLADDIRRLEIMKNTISNMESDQP